MIRRNIIPLWDAHADTLRSLRRNAVRALREAARLTTPALPLRSASGTIVAGGAREDGVDRYAWLNKEKPCGEPCRTILPGQDWELEIRKAVRER